MNKSSILLCTIALTALMFSCENKNTTDKAKPDATDTVKEETVPIEYTSIKFEDTLYNFGKIREGEKVEHTFRFSNAGEHPLLVRNANASCGCTIPEWTKHPVLPGKDGVITVTYNSTGRSGIIHKTISVLANTRPEETVLTIEVEVLPKENAEKPK
jgi:hypothetical protein